MIDMIDKRPKPAPLLALHVVKPPQNPDRHSADMIDSQNATKLVAIPGMLWCNRISYTKTRYQEQKS